MSPQVLVDYAEKIATEAHEGQFRRGGRVPFIEHPRAVVSRVGQDYDLQVIAWLHDVIEDTSETAESLEGAGIPSELVDEIVLLTKTRETTYEHYLERVATSKIATKVKIADILSNLADNPTKKQVRKYAKALLRLTQPS